MPFSKAKQAEYQKKRRLAQKRAAGAQLMSSADVRAMRKAGLRVEDLQGEEGEKVSFQTFSALLRDRDAIKAHMGWHHESMKNPDVATVVERVIGDRWQTRVVALEERNTQLEADLALLRFALEGLPAWR